MKTTITKTMFQIFAVLFTASISFGQTTHDVTASGMSFSPSNLTIEVGDTVRWTNTSGTHNVNGTTSTFPSNPESFGNSLGTGWIFDHKFTIAGTYAYRCDQHFSGGMAGLITVVDPSANVENISASTTGIVSVYPIPSSDEVTISLSPSLVDNSKTLVIVLIDLTGKEVLRHEVNQSTLITLNVAELQKASYILQLMDGTTTIEHRTISIH